MAAMSSSRLCRRPESVLVLVHTGAGDVLLLKRSRPIEFWQSVTGCLDPGETHDQAARRELAEETGFGDEGELAFTGTERVFEIDPRWRDRYAPGVMQNTEYEWRYRVERVTPIRLDVSEHKAYCWMPLDRATEMVWSWTNRDALEALKADL